MFHLDGIAPAPRGIPQIEVSFDIDTNGILSVSAKDKATGKEQHIRIEASSGLSESEIQRMRDEAKANEEADKAEKERVDKINNADGLAFQVEKFLRENGDKVPADKKSALETPLNALKEAVKAQNIADIDRYTEELNKVMSEVYSSMSGAGAQGGPQGGPGFDPNAGGFNPGSGPQGPQGGGNDTPDEQ